MREPFSSNPRSRIKGLIAALSPAFGLLVLAIVLQAARAQVCSNPVDNSGCGVGEYDPNFPWPPPCDYTSCLGGGGPCPDGSGNNWIRSQVVRFFGENYRCLWTSTIGGFCTQARISCGLTVFYLDDCNVSCGAGNYWTQCLATANSDRCP